MCAKVAFVTYEAISKQNILCGVLIISLALCRVALLYGSDLIDCSSLGSFRRGKANPITIAMEVVSSMAILGVLISNDPHSIHHIEGLITPCSRSLSALRVLRSHGLRPTWDHWGNHYRPPALCILAWWGLTPAKDRVAKMVYSAEDSLLQIHYH